MADGLPLDWLDWLVKTLLGLLGGLLGWLWKDARAQIAEMRARMETQDKALAVLQSTLDGRQALMLGKIESMEGKLEGFSHVLETVNETLTQMRIEQARTEQARKDGQ